ncbi:MAG: hypothetical protein HYV97_10430 [Bdellovibrio sp.]|nr:hypothetical protein [Bdellovibrio sp.]
MKNIFLLVCVCIFSVQLEASCVNWTEVYRCGNGAVSLHRGQSWCGENKIAYHLAINSKHAQQHLGQLARTELSFLSLQVSENYGVFTSKVNQYVTAKITEGHQQSSLNIELFLDSKKLGEYIFRDCDF